MESAGVSSVFLFALLTAVATGFGAVPFAFAKHPSRRWLGASNAVAAGLMLAASFGLIYEGMNYGPCVLWWVPCSVWRSSWSRADPSGKMNTRWSSRV
jgi:hypothetical protein